MKIYTRHGDAGETGLIGGERVGKEHARLSAYGSVDELNANIGLARAFDETGELHAALTSIQADLLVIGSLLAAPDPGKVALPALDDKAVIALEALIDGMEEKLPPLRNFIMPGGSPQGAALHIGRTVCRRVEREVVALSRTAEVPEEIIVYLNRLSDFLFVAARYVNRRAGTEETPWIPDKRESE